MDKQNACVLNSRPNGAKLISVDEGYCIHSVLTNISITNISVTKYKDYKVSVIKYKDYKVSVTKYKDSKVSVTKYKC